MSVDLEEATFTIADPGDVVFTFSDNDPDRDATIASIKIGSTTYAKTKYTFVNNVLTLLSAGLETYTTAQDVVFTVTMSTGDIFTLTVHVVTGV